MGSISTDATLPWIRTPCIFSPQLSRIAGCNIHLKLDNLQPSGSFKSRGVGNLMTRAAADAPGGQVHFYCSSGGNAGLACASSAVSLRCRATIVIPTATSALMKAKLLELGVEVYQVGKSWFEADTFLREELLAKDPTGIYVPPFDHPHLWDGAASIIAELRDQMDVMPDAVVCSVGGGGLVNGLMQGIDDLAARGYYDHQQPARPRTQVLAVETQGADALNASVRAGKHITLPAITSIATSLGAVRVSAETWRWYQNSDNMHSMVVSDADAAISCVRFADDARLVVEVSCGAALATVYRGDLRRVLGQGLSDQEWASKVVVIEVCGGSSVTLGMLDTYKETYGPQTSIKV